MVVVGDTDELTDGWKENQLKMSEETLEEDKMRMGKDALFNAVVGNHVKAYNQ